MEIYVRVDDGGEGDHAWYYKDDIQSYLIGAFYNCEGEIAATAFKTAAEAKRYGKEAKDLMLHDGAFGKVTVSFWRFLHGRLTKTKFDKNGKIKK